MALEDLRADWAELQDLALRQGRGALSARLKASGLTIGARLRIEHRLFSASTTNNAATTDSSEAAASADAQAVRCTPSIIRTERNARAGSDFAHQVPPLPPGACFLQLNPDYPNLVRVEAQPPVFVVDAFLSDAECDALVRPLPPSPAQSSASRADRAHL